MSSPLVTPVPSNPQVFEKVRSTFVDALGVDADEVTMKAKVIDDLGAESLDFLDIAYRLEQSFKIKIPRGEIKAKSQEGLAAEEWEKDGLLTEKALSKLREAMPEVPAADIKHGLKAKDIPRLFTVETFYNMVLKLQAETGGPGGPEAPTGGARREAEGRPSADKKDPPKQA
jgi:acyl carrier protein